jgi:hypothetical protein
MMQRGRFGCAGWLAAILLAGCGGHSADGVQLGGETNWLGSCHADAECGVGHCLCNLCTVQCTAAESCSGGPTESRCVEASELGTSCASAVSGGICVASPTSDAGNSTPAGSGLDAARDLLSEDLGQLPSADWPFTRYIAFGGLSTEGYTGYGTTEYQNPRGRGRLALNKLANSLSSKSQITLPAEVDDQRLFQRIDLRDYGWDRPITVDGVPYADGWEAIVAHASLAVEYPLDRSGALEDRTGTRVPWLFVSDFVAAAGTGNTYYELLDLPDTLAQLEQRLTPAGAEAAITYGVAIDLAAESGRTRWVQQVQSTGAGHYWRAFDFADISAQAVYDTPLGVSPDASELIFSLPNGLQAFFTADSSGRRVSDAPVSRDPTQKDWVMRNAVSCFNCHNVGIKALETYPDRELVQQSMAADSVSYLQALQALGAADMGDTVARVYDEFRWWGVQLPQAAAELFVTPEQLRARLAELPASLQVLGDADGSVSRGVFVSAYGEALCTLHHTDAVLPARCR